MMPDLGLTAELPTLHQALIALPLATLCGTALAFRPRRRGTPPRNPAVIQTQILLALIGAVIMLVVGASLARAFGIAGAANLARVPMPSHDVYIERLLGAIAHGDGDLDQAALAREQSRASGLE